MHVKTYLDWATPVLISTPWSWPPLSRDTPCSLVSSMFMNNVHLLETDLRCLLDCSQCTTSTKCPSLSLAVSNQSKIDTWLNWTSHIFLPTFTKSNLDCPSPPNQTLKVFSGVFLHIQWNTEIPTKDTFLLLLNLRVLRISAGLIKEVDCSFLSGANMTHLSLGCIF